MFRARHDTKLPFTLPSLNASRDGQLPKCATLVHCTYIVMHRSMHRFRFIHLNCNDKHIRTETYRSVRISRNLVKRARAYRVVS